VKGGRQAEEEEGKRKGEEGSTRRKLRKGEGEDGEGG
jgi:hypothetical protein